MLLKCAFILWLIINFIIRYKKYLLLFLLIPFIPVFTWIYKILFAKIDYNDCMISYVYDLKYNWYKRGYWYDNHIDVILYKKDTQIWKVNWCLFYWNKNIWSAYSNIIYCNLVYKLT